MGVPLPRLTFYFGVFFCTWGWPGGGKNQKKKEVQLKSERTKKAFPR